jgi:Ras-related protein Rab-7A
VYDITNRASLDNIENWKNSFLQKSMVVSPDSFPFMVIGNKNDLEDDKRAVDKDQALKYVKNLGDDIDHIETSAKN